MHTFTHTHACTHSHTHAHTRTHAQVTEGARAAAVAQEALLASQAKRAEAYKAEAEATGSQLAAAQAGLEAAAKERALLVGVCWGGLRGRGLGGACERGVQSWAAFPCVRRVGMEGGDEGTEATENKTAHWG